MSTKGASNRYGSRSNKPTKHTGYAWAKGFNKKTLDYHYNQHGKEFGTKEEYAAHAVAFANTIDRTNNVSFIAKNNSTYRYNLKTNEFAIIDSKGYVITYFKPKESYDYYKKQERIHKK